MFLHTFWLLAELRSSLFCGDVEIIFKGIHDPVAIQEEVNERIAASQERAED